MGENIIQDTILFIYTYNKSKLKCCNQERICIYYSLDNHIKVDPS